MWNVLDIMERESASHMELSGGAFHTDHFGAIRGIINAKLYFLNHLSSKLISFKKLTIDFIS
jgi:hypothetical protein